MSDIDEMLNEELETMQSDSMINDEITIDPVTRMMNVPITERLFGVKDDANVEKKYFRCPRYVGDNIDLSKLKIYMKYVHAVGNTPEEWEDTIPQFTWCDDVKVDGNDIVWTWKLSANVFTKKGFMAFAMVAKDENTVAFNTYPAIGTVLTTIPYGSEELSMMHPDIVTQLLKRMDSVEAIATPEAMQNYVNTYLEANPLQLDETLKDSKKAAPSNIVGELKGDLVDLNELDFSKVLTIKDEYVDQSGVITPYKTWARTDYLPVPKGNILKIKTPNLTSMYDSVYNCFYDKDKKFISYFKTVMNKENRIVIPYGAVYYILSGEYKDLMTQIEVQKKITLNVEENSDRILNNGIFVNKSLYTHFTRIGENKYIFREFKRYEVNYILDLYRMYIGHIENNSPVEDEKIGTSSSDVIGPVSICNTLTGTYSWSGGVHGIKIGETTYPTAENVSVKLFCDGKEITRDGFYIGKIRIICENDLYFPQTITDYDRTDATKAIREKRVYTLTDKMNVKVFLSTYTDCYINYYYGCQCLTYDMTDIYLPNNELHTSYSEISNYLLFNKREQKYYCSKDNRHYDVEVHPFGLGSYYLNDGSNPSYKFGNIASFRKIYHQFIANNTKIENNKCLMWEADYDYYID